MPMLLSFFTGSVRSHSPPRPRPCNAKCCNAFPKKIGGCRFSGDYELYKNDIDGTAGQSWRVPLSDAGGVEPVRMADQNQKWARVTAAKALISGHRAVAKFATRALGESGRGVSAPFADPFRKSEPRMELHVDLALRVSHRWRHNGIIECHASCRQLGELTIAGGRVVWVGRSLLVRIRSVVT